MKHWITATVGIVTLSLLADAGLAQPPGGRDGGPGGRPGFRQGGPGGGPGGQGPGRDFQPPRHPLMTALDTDGDGELSAEEIEGAVAALKTLDKDGDGCLGRDELRPQFGGPGGRGPGGPGGRGPGHGGPGGHGPGQAGPGGGGPGGRGPGGDNFVERIMGFDTNEDGKVDASEMPEPMQRMVQRGDTNGDKALDRDELETLAKQFAARRGGQGGGGQGGGPRGGRGGPGGQGGGRQQPK